MCDIIMLKNALFAVFKRYVIFLNGVKILSKIVILCYHFIV